MGSRSFTQGVPARPAPDRSAQRVAPARASQPPSALLGGQADLLQLQRTLGNRAVQRLLGAARQPADSAVQRAHVQRVAVQSSGPDRRTVRDFFTGNGTISAQEITTLDQ